MVTQKDISAACGLSVSAVSKALSDYSDISEETKQRVREVAARMGYHGVKTEITQKRSHTYIAGLLITEEMEQDSCMNVVQELRKALVRRGYDLVLLSPVREESKGADRPGYLPRARLFGMEGVFFISRVDEIELYHQEDFRDLRELILGEIPVVALGSFFASCSCVLPGYEKGIRSLINEIYRRGHRRIAFVYREGTGERGVCRKAIHLALRENHLDIPEFYLCGVTSDTAAEAYSETMKLLQKSHWLRPTCILFSDDMLLEGGTAALRHSGLRIPEDICVAAIRISEECRVRDFPVISWRIPPSEIAVAAVELMFDGLQGTSRGMGRIRMIDGMLDIEEEKGMHREEKRELCGKE